MRESWEGVAILSLSGQIMPHFPPTFWQNIGYSLYLAPVPQLEIAWLRDFQVEEHVGRDTTLPQFYRTYSWRPVYE